MKKQKNQMKNTQCIRTLYDPVFLERIRQDIEQKEKLFHHYHQQLSALANPVRLQIAYILYRYGALCVCDLSEVLGMSMSAVSQHLNRMKEAQIVFSNQQGRTIFYELNENLYDVFLPLFLSLKHNWKNQTYETE